MMLAEVDALVAERLGRGPQIEIPIEVIRRKPRVERRAGFVRRWKEFEYPRLYQTGSPSGAQTRHQSREAKVPANEDSVFPITMRVADAPTARASHALPPSGGRITLSH